jgi:hypothetical protein
MRKKLALMFLTIVEDTLTHGLLRVEVDFPPFSNFFSKMHFRQTIFAVLSQTLSGMRMHSIVGKTRQRGH